jgi:hypothetical protein
VICMFVAVLEDLHSAVHTFLLCLSLVADCFKKDFVRFRTSFLAILL